MGNTHSRTRAHVNQSHAEKDDNFQSFEIVWLNAMLLENQLSSLSEYNSRFFDNSKECQEYLDKIPMNGKVMFLVEEQCAENIVQTVHKLCSVKLIFIIHPVETNINQQTNLSPQYSKIKHVQLNQLADQIHWFEGRFLRNSKEFFSIDIFKANQTSEDSSTKLNGRFLFTQLLLDILLRMEQKFSDKDELIAHCSEYFANNKTELGKINEFQQKSNPKQVFEWYSKDSFVYRLLNKALRTENIDLLFLYRFLLQDLQNELTLHQEQSIITVSRGQLLSKREWKELANSVNG